MPGMRMSRKTTSAAPSVNAPSAPSGRSACPTSSTRPVAPRRRASRVKASGSSSTRKARSQPATRITPGAAAAGRSTPPCRPRSPGPRARRPHRTARRAGCGACRVRGPRGWRRGRTCLPHPTRIGAAAGARGESPRRRFPGAQRQKTNPERRRMQPARDQSGNGHWGKCLAAGCLDRKPVALARCRLPSAALARPLRVPYPTGGAQMPVGRSLVAVALAVLLALSAVSPAPAADAPAGTLTIGVHVTLVNRWLDPGEVDGLITPFMVLYIIHDALVKPMPGNITAPSLAESWTHVEGRAHATSSCSAKGVKFHNGDPVTAEDVKFSLRALPGAAAPSSSRTRCKEVQVVDAEPRALRPEGAVAGLHDVLRDLRHRRGAGSCRRSTSRRSATTASRRRRSAPARTSS